MKRIFRRNQIIITTLAVMIAAAGYLNYSAKMEAGDGDVYEAGMMEISDEDILAENQHSGRVYGSPHRPSTKGHPIPDYPVPAYTRNVRNIP